MTSTIKVDNIQDQDGNNIINENSNTITIGASGDTVTLASGASQTGFGRTGTVDWQTGSIKTATFTAANGEGYFANTSGGAFTMNLPSATAGNIVSVVDYTNTFQTNNLTISPNGSQKIGGTNANVTLSTEGQSLTFVYVDDTEGWKNVQDSTSNVTGLTFITATGGTITTSGNCKIHTFTGPGTFSVSAASSCSSYNTVSYVVVAGGGGGGGVSEGGAGGGGAGGFREVKSPTTPYTASPLDGYPSSPNRVTVSATSYPITVGGGGTAGNSEGRNPPGSNSTQGSTSTFSTISSAGGGKGGQGGHPYGACSGIAGGPGGSGGGGHGATTAIGGCGAGTGNTPPVSPAQGTNGGAGNMDNSNSSGQNGGGGGGATVAGTAGAPYPCASPGGCGGAGATTSITASPVAYAGGGGGGRRGTAPSGTAGSGGTGGGGAGKLGDSSGPGVDGTANTGGGGGGGGRSEINPSNPAGGCGGAGGSGVVIIRYRYQ